MFDSRVFDRNVFDATDETAEEVARLDRRRSSWGEPKRWRRVRG